MKLKAQPTSIIEGSTVSTEPAKRPHKKVDSNNTTTPTTAASVASTTIFEPSMKHPRDRKTTRKTVADALLNVGETAERLAISKTDEAIHILQEDYANELSEDEMVNAMEIFENMRKSEMCVAMRKGNIRDNWLRKQLPKC